MVDKTLASITALLERLTFRRVGLFAAVAATCLASYIGYVAAPNIAARLVPQYATNVVRPVEATPAVRASVDAFMARWQGVAVYFTLLQFDFTTNLRTPVYRAFNSEPLRQIVTQRNGTSSGALPIFIKDDTGNNKQMIAALRGEMTCEPYRSGGLGVKWPDLASMIHTSCRVPVPPAYGVGVRGYYVLHLSRALTTYETEALRTEMLALADTIHEGSHP